MEARTAGECVRGEDGARTRGPDCCIELGGRQRTGKDDTRCAVHTKEPVSEGRAY